MRRKEDTLLDKLLTLAGITIRLSRQMRDAGEMSFGARVNANLLMVAGNQIGRQARLRTITIRTARVHASRLLTAPSASYDIEIQNSSWVSAVHLLQRVCGGAASRGRCF